MNKFGCARRKKHEPGPWNQATPSRGRLRDFTSDQQEAVHSAAPSTPDVLKLDSFSYVLRNHMMGKINGAYEF
jgi:hypothetical protein